MAQGTLVSIICHGIGTPARELEPGEAPYWVSEDQFDALLDRIMAAPHQERICLTFDDGNASDFEIAFPKLEERGLKGSFFVLTDRLGQPGSLSEAQIKELLAAGHTVGSHGAAHLDWSGLSETALQAEILPSLQCLSTLIGREVDQVAIPFGRWSGRVMRALRQAGVKTAWTSDGGPARAGAFLRPRTSIRGDMTDADLDRLVACPFPIAARLRRQIAMARKQVWGPR